MSKFPKAPLVEVIFELRWNSTTKESLTRYQYIHGDLYNKIKHKYSNRELLIPTEVPSEVYVNTVAHRFRESPGKYPLIQVGPGVLTVNTIDEIYHWPEFENEIINIVDDFLEIHPFKDVDKVSPLLQYFDFLAFDFTKHDIYNFLLENLHIDISQSFLKTTAKPHNLNLSFFYQTEVGELVLTISQGKDKLENEGIMIRTLVKGMGMASDSEKIKLWLAHAHEFCSQLFKDMTKGDMYNNFTT